MRGYFGIGIEHGKHRVNLGTLWRSAYVCGAAFIFTVGQRYKTQTSDTLNTPTHVPLFEYASIEELLRVRPFGAPLIGVELTPSATSLASFSHPTRAVYLLGAEDHGLSREARSACQQLVVLPGERSVNVAVAGSVVMMDRVMYGRKQ